MSQQGQVRVLTYNGKRSKHCTLPVVDLWKLSTYNTRGREKGRPGRARQFRKAQRLTFEGLPGEIRDKIFEYAYAPYYAKGKLKVEA